MDLQHHLHDGDRVLLGWRARSWKNHDKDRKWYIAAGVPVALLIVLMFINENWLGGVLFGLIGGAYYIFAHAEPDILDVSISELGVYYGQQFWQYQEIRQFWMIISDQVRTLHLETIGDRGHTDEVMIQLEDVNPLDVREMLAKNVPEAEGRKEDFFHRLGRWLRI
jgi:hypothetical protein